MENEHRFQKSTAFDVIRGNKITDTVWFTGYTESEARKSLIEHDGYPPDIRVKARPVRK